METSFILGTAQFGENYGISNKSGILIYDNAKRILSLARKKNIKLIDTAIDCIEGQKILNNLDLQNFSVITKLPSLISKDNKLDYVRNTVMETIQKLNIKSYHAILLHRPEEILIQDNRSDIIKILDTIKKNGYTSKIGISVYSTETATKALDIYPFDIIQAPVNIIDRRFIEDDFQNYLTNKNIKLHARSIFLQGLLLMNKKNIPPKFSKWKNIFNAWDEWLLSNNLSPVEACVKFVKCIKEIDSIVIGVQSEEELKEIIEIESGNKILFPSLSTKLDEALINPKMWN